ncbi:hypothetical protein D3C76_1284300 [compost metagenome]
MQRQCLHLGNLMQQQRHQGSISPFLLIHQRHINGGHQQLTHQRGYAHHLAGLGDGRDQRVRLDIQAASAHSHHPDFMCDLRRDPYGALRWHHPISLPGKYLHHTRSPIQQLRAAVAMQGQQIVRRIVGANRYHRPWCVIEGINGGIAHSLPYHFGRNAMIVDR